MNEPAPPKIKLSLYEFPTYRNRQALFLSNDYRVRAGQTVIADFDKELFWRCDVIDFEC